MLTIEQWLKFISCEFAIPVANLLEGAWNARLTEDGDGVVFYYTSEDGLNLLDIFVKKDGTIAWFYRNRLTGQSEGDDSLTEIPTALKEKLHELKLRC